MSKAIFSQNTGKYTLIGLDEGYPSQWYGKKVKIEGQEYNAVIVYDLPNHIAIESDKDFLNKEIEFV